MGLDTDSQPDLLAPLAPPAEDLARQPGTIEGPPGWHEGFGAGLRVWCGPALGWRSFGDLVQHAHGGLLLHKGRLTVGLVWDLGPAPIRRGRDQLGEEGDAAPESEGCPQGREVE